MFVKGIWAQLQAAAKAGAGEYECSARTSVIEAHRSDVDIPWRAHVLPIFS